MKADIKYKVGLEIHITIKTDKKLFHSGSINEIDIFDLGTPGTMPSKLNWIAIKKATMLADLLRMKRCKYINFDRKIYNYPDLPAGYQITQKRYPQYKDGYIKNKNKIFKINAMHIENDAGRIWKGKPVFNRVNKTLVELTTQPNFETWDEVNYFIRTLQIICKMHGISDAKMEDGDIRFDVNISFGNNEEWSERFEVKNMNSVTNIKNAMKWVTNFKDSKIPLTLKYTETGLEIMREKEEYLYVVEGDIPRYKLPSFKKYNNVYADEYYLETFGNLDHIIDSIYGPLILKHIETYDVNKILNLLQTNPKLMKLDNMDELMNDISNKKITTNELRHIEKYQRNNPEDINYSEFIKILESYPEKYNSAISGNKNAQKSFIGILIKEFPQVGRYDIVMFIEKYFNK